MLVYLVMNNQLHVESMGRTESYIRSRHGVYDMKKPTHRSFEWRVSYKKRLATCIRLLGTHVASKDVEVVRMRCEFWGMHQDGRVHSRVVNMMNVLTSLSFPPSVFFFFLKERKRKYTIMNWETLPSSEV